MKTRTNRTPAQRRSSPVRQGNESANYDPIAILRTAVSCEPLTPQEVAAAAQYRDTSGQLLAAALIHRMASPGEGNDKSGLLAYLAHKRAVEGLASLATDRSRMALTKETERLARQHQRQVLGAERDAHAHAAKEFQGALSAVLRVADQFERTHMPDGKPNWEELSKLYDQTDALEHPVLGAIPKADTYPDQDPRRDAVVRADRLMRFMLAQTIETFPN